MELVDCDAVYSLVLEADANVALNGAGNNSESGVIIGNLECATLGHGW